MDSRWGASTFSACTKNLAKDQPTGPGHAARTVEDHPEVPGAIIDDSPGTVQLWAHDRDRLIAAGRGHGAKARKDAGWASSDRRAH